MTDGYMEILKKIPVWFMVTLLSIACLVVLAMVGYAVADGRRVDLWPPVIHEKNSAQVNDLKQQIEARHDYLAPQAIIKLFPLESQKNSLPLTRQATQDLVNDYRVKWQSANVSVTELRAQLDEVERVHGTFLYKLLIFNQDAQCYGSSLNFTAGKDKAQCLSKQKLAQQFLEFLAEVDFYQNDQENSVATAKQQLLKLQDKYQFNTKGWYGPDVFKSIINEFHGKS